MLNNNRYCFGLFHSNGCICIWRVLLSIMAVGGVLYRLVLITFRLDDRTEKMLRLYWRLQIYVRNVQTNLKVISNMFKCTNIPLLKINLEDTVEFGIHFSQHSGESGYFLPPTSFFKLVVFVVNSFMLISGRKLKDAVSHSFVALGFAPRLTNYFILM